MKTFQIQEAIDEVLIDYILTVNNQGKIVSVKPLIYDLPDLKFTFQRASNNPNKIVLTGKGNCIGYAALFSAVANYLINKAEGQDRFQSKHLVGKLDFLGIDLNALFTSPFYKNHDYNLIEDKKTGVVLLIDPSIDDYLYLGTQILN